MPLFKPNARVCFLGDSITAHAHFADDILSYYRTHFPERRVKMYSVGVPGDTAMGCYRRRRHIIMMREYAPTDVVLMFGINDVAWYRYAAYEQDKAAFAADRAVSHTVAMERIVSELRAMGVRIWLCSSPPYDDVYAARDTQCAAALAAMHRADLAALSRFSIVGTVDFGTEMLALLRALKARGGESIIGDDHVHPKEMGHHVMARLFLRMQGETEAVAAPTAESVLDGSCAMPPLTPIEHERRAVQGFLRNLSFIDFNQSWGQETMTLEEKCAYWRDSANVARLEAIGAYQGSRARAYPDEKLREAQMLATYLRLTDALYE